MSYVPIFPQQFQCTTCQAIVQDQAGHDAYHARYALVSAPVVPPVPPASLVPPVMAPSSPAPVAAPVAAPGGPGMAARKAAGVHADDNVYQQAPYDRNNSATAYARGAAFAGFTPANPPAWNMIECAPDLGLHAYILGDLATNPTGNFISGVGGFPTPRMNFTIYGCFSNPAANCAAVAAGAADAALTYLFQKINLVKWPQIAIRYGWEVDGGWFAWGVDPVSYIAAFKHVRALGNSVLDLAKTPKGVLWEWNAFALRGSPNAKNGYGHSTMDYWVGKDFCDVIGCDTYRVNNDANDSVWLDTAKKAAAFAIAQGLQVGFSEVGLWDQYNGSAATLEASGASTRAWIDFLAFCDSLPPDVLVYHHAFDGNPGTGLFRWSGFPKARAAYADRMTRP